VNASYELSGLDRVQEGFQKMELIIIVFSLNESAFIYMLSAAKSKEFVHS